ncbi:early nodulin-55-1-like [Cajanus cajan]|uniref:early nodulin-55-1-like n=1 Tax=Cajanus cajan TaxID=3821 RepID=UPI0010FB57C0|nr:early nodulin-55-1-like [Cajanus cajan]
MTTERYFQNYLYKSWLYQFSLSSIFQIKEFKFDDKFYNLIQVSQQEYEHCTSLEPLRIFNSSPVILPLKERGVLYFTCSISNYCCLGQKIVIYVHDRPLPPPPPQSPSPSQAPITISPQLSPNALVPQPQGSSPPSPTTNTPGTNGGNPPVPSSPREGKSNAVALIGGRSFIVPMWPLLSMVGVFFGFWMM